MAFPTSVNGGNLETDLNRWTPMHEDDEALNHSELVDPGLNPEEALIAREEHQDEEDDIDHLDGVANPKTTRSEFLPEEE